MRFTLDITLGNDAMKDGRDVANALHDIANVVGDHEIDTTRTSVIRDTNGNRVGVARFVSDDAPKALDCVILKITGPEMGIYDGCRVSVHNTQAEAEDEFRDWLEEFDGDASDYTVNYEPTYLNVPAPTIMSLES
jgi:hypothetical protein